MTIPADYCRCEGKGCDRREQCDRYLDRGFQQTPWTERFCPVGRESEGFIEVRLWSVNGERHARNEKM